MHPEAMQWVAEHAIPEAKRVLDIGGRNINGTPRDLFPVATAPGGTYRCLDVLPGEGVDIVADAGTWRAEPGVYDVVVCTEVFEHAENWRDICRTAFEALAPGGLFIATMAGPGRPVHSGVDGGWQLHPGEHYGNVHPRDLAEALAAAGFVDVVTDRRSQPADTRCTARRPA
jgi:SAM-dependent methyltransferase